MKKSEQIDEETMDIWKGFLSQSIDQMNENWKNPIDQWDETWKRPVPPTKPMGVCFVCGNCQLLYDDGVLKLEDVLKCCHSKPKRNNIKKF